MSPVRSWLEPPFGELNSIRKGAIFFVFFICLNVKKESRLTRFYFLFSSLRLFFVDFCFLKTLIVNDKIANAKMLDTKM